MTRRASAYTVEKLAPGSYDVLINGRPVASLTRSMDGLEDPWRIELLAETLPSERPAPFEAQSHTFVSYRAALDWLGIIDEVAARKTISRTRPARALPQYRDRLSPMERYRLRLLSEHSRFYATTTGIRGLIAREFIASTGEIDKDGRAEWAITEAGRVALAEIMS